MAQPHFTRASASLEGTNLCVSFKEAGLGDNQLITYVLSAQATAEYACINKGGQHPQASNKETVSGPVTNTGTFSSGKNGQVTATLCVSPPQPGNFSCPPGQMLVLVSVSYTNILLTDTTNNESVGITGTFSETFVDLS